MSDILQEVTRIANRIFAANEEIEEALVQEHEFQQEFIRELIELCYKLLSTLYRPIGLISYFALVSAVGIGGLFVLYRLVLKLIELVLDILDRIDDNARGGPWRDSDEEMSSAAGTALRTSTSTVDRKDVSTQTTEVSVERQSFNPIVGPSAVTQPPLATDTNLRHDSGTLLRRDFGYGFRYGNCEGPQLTDFLAGNPYRFLPFTFEGPFSYSGFDQARASHRGRRGRRGRQRRGARDARGRGRLDFQPPH